MLLTVGFELKQVDVDSSPCFVVAQVKVIEGAFRDIGN